MKEICLDGYTVESITLDNLNQYEAVFYSNEEYYRITDGHPATKEDCIETVEYCMDGFAKDKIYNIGFSYKGEAVACLFIIEGYPQSNILWLGLFLVHHKYKRKALGSMCIKALIDALDGLAIDRIRLSVQDNNVAGVAFWKHIGFSVIGKTDCGKFTNLTMEYRINKADG